MGYYRPLQWGHAKLSQQCWFQSPFFAVDNVSQQSPHGLSYFQNLTFSKPPLDDGLCLASTVTCYYPSTLCIGWLRKAFPTMAFPPIWMNGKNLFPSPRREVMRYVVSHKPQSLLRLRGGNFLVPLSQRKYQVSTSQ